MNINFTYDPGTTLEQILVFETAGKLWSQYLQDDVTVNLQVGVTHANNLPTGVIGGALPGMSANVNYRDFKDAHEADMTSADDAIAEANLSFSSARYVHEHVTADGTGSISGLRSARNLNMTRANAKALDLGVNNSSGIDGYILMSNLAGQGVSWDYDVTAPASGKLDFFSTALHEIGHALGFVSGVDQPGWVAAVVNSTSKIDLYNASISSRSRGEYINPIDLFRYSGRSDGYADIGYGSTLGEKYFSIDGGNTALANFSSGSDTAAGGDGYQASHWKNQSNALGIMDPTLGLGERANISALDLRAFDVMGWDVNAQGANQAVNLANLRDQALQDIASRINKSVSWVTSKPDKAAERLSQVRVMEIAQMAEDSEVYDLSWLNPGGGDSYWLNWGNPNAGSGYWINWWNQGGGQGWWQTMEQLFQQRGLFSTIDLSELGELNSGSPSTDIDALTGLNRQQPVVATTSGDAVTAPPSVSREQFEGLESFAATQAIAEASSSGLTQSYGSLAALSLGRATGRELLGNGLASLGQDQLQGAAQLAPLFATGSHLG